MKIYEPFTNNQWIHKKSLFDTVFDWWRDWAVFFWKCLQNGPSCYARCVTIQLLHSNFPPSSFPGLRPKLATQIVRLTSLDFFSSGLYEAKGICKCLSNDFRAKTRNSTCYLRTTAWFMSKRAEVYKAGYGGLWLILFLYSMLMPQLYIALNILIVYKKSMFFF